MNKPELIEFTAKEKIYKVRIGQQGEYMLNKESNEVLRCDIGKEFILEDSNNNIQLKGISELCDEYYVDNHTAGRLMKGETVYMQNRPISIKVLLFDIKTANQKNSLIKINENKNVMLNNIKGERLAFKIENDKLTSPFVITEKELMMNYELSDDKYINIDKKHNKIEEKVLPKHASQQSLERYYQTNETSI